MKTLIISLLIVSSMQSANAYQRASDILQQQANNAINRNHIGDDLYTTGNPDAPPGYIQLNFAAQQAREAEQKEDRDREDELRRARNGDY